MKRFMLDIIKSIVWILVAVFLGYHIMNYMGYEVNNEYFTYSKKQCEQKLRDCAQKFAKQDGSDSICDIKCVDPKLIIKKK